MFPPRDPPKEPVVALHYPPQPVTYTASINGMLAIEAPPTVPESEQQPTEQQPNPKQNVNYPRRMISVAPPPPGKSILNCGSSGSPAASPGYLASTPNGSQEPPASPSGSPLRSNPQHPAHATSSNASPTSITNIDKDSQAAETAAQDAGETPANSAPTKNKAGLYLY